MPLASGDRLGPYEIVAPIGAGGMGEVYKSRDTRLDRTVAVKVLPDHIAKRDDLRARFEREARAVASLNHPHICTLHDIGPGYMVMELIEGESLAARIEKGAVPLEQALLFAAQIADALDRAHRAGVTHRDVKPQNIMLTRDGVKVLDFGLAKSAAKPGPTEETLTAVLTTEGTIMGTPQYMAPEQFAGKEADARSDIWAFGAVLYEMVTGRKAFLGANYQSLVGAILANDPAPMAVTPFTPSWLERLVRRCLEKDPEERYQSMRDIVLELRKPPVGEAATAAAPPGARLPWMAATAVLGVIAAVALWAPWRANQPDIRPLVRLDVDLGEDVSLPPMWASPVAISPDGTRLVYPSGNPATLFTRRLDQPKAVEIPGTQGPPWLFAFFSPDGQWIGFPSISNKLYKASVEGGAAVQLGANPAFTGGGWDEHGNIVAGGAGTGLVWFPAGGGKPETLVNEPAYRPQILPGAKAVLYHTIKREAEGEQFNIEVLTLAGRLRKIVAHGASPKYLPTAKGAGHLVYLDKATMFAIEFDPTKMETRGAAVPVLDDVASYPVSVLGGYDFTPAPFGHGTLVYRRASRENQIPTRTLQWVYPNSGPNEKREPLSAKPALYGTARLSPDGKRMALMITAAENGGRDLWVYDIQRDVMTRLTFNGTIPTLIRWSPDGQYVVFGSAKGVMQVRADGASRAQALTDSPSAQHPGSFTGDGKRLAYFDGRQIWTAPVEDQDGRLKAGKPDLFLDRGGAAAFSPDGRWLAYQSSESGKSEVYVRAFPPPSSGTAGQWQISNNGGSSPHWSSNGRELLYQAGGQIMAVGYTAKGNAFQADKPRVWIAKLGGTSWDLAPDGKRMLVTTAVESEQVAKPEHVIVMLQNFFDYLRQRVPLSK